MQTWTVAQVKERLPNVLVRFSPKGKTYTGRISGRLKPLATVTVDDSDSLKRGGPLWHDLEVAWSTIAHCLNTNKPIRG